MFPHLRRLVFCPTRGIGCSLVSMIGTREIRNVCEALICQPQITSNTPEVKISKWKKIRMLETLKRSVNDSAVSGTRLMAFRKKENYRFMWVCFSNLLLHIFKKVKIKINTYLLSCYYCRPLLTAQHKYLMYSKTFWGSGSFQLQLLVDKTEVLRI